MAGTPFSAADLNPAQREAVEHSGGPLIVLAGPGTGKTRVIVHRVERLIRGGADPRHIVAITFTNKAAAELRDRLTALLGSSAADRMYAGTIHGFGDSLIRRFGDLIDLPARHVLLDSSRRRRLMRDLVREHDLYADLVPTGRQAILDDAANVIDRLQNWCVLPAEAEGHAQRWAARLKDNPDQLDGEALAAERVRAQRFSQHARLYAAFDAACRKRGWYGYGDMVLLAVRLLRESADAAALARDGCRHVVVDEFQDVDRGQIELLRLLCPAKKDPDLCVVGDDDQSIYGFRGADDRAFAHFAAIWPAARTVKLEWNYRSEAPIVETANAIMSRAAVRFAPDKVVALPPGKEDTPAGAAVEVVEYARLDQEGDAVAAMILAERRRNPGCPCASFAVIGRAYTDLDRVAGALAVEGIPARVARGASILDDRGVQDLLRWVEVLCDPGAVYAAQWVLSRPPFDVPMQHAAEWGRRHRADVSRRAAGEDGRDEPAAFVPWLAARFGTDPRVARFARVYAELHEAAGRVGAHDAMLRIIGAGQIAHAELLPARRRADRIGRLAEVLRFARDRTALLDPPGDLRALWSYYNDLSDDEQAFRSDDSERFTEQPAGDDAKPDEVTLLTAHKAKGLEFDTVFVLRAFPADGFPKTRSPDDEDLPEGLVDRAGDTRDAQTRKEAEERRLFYVACTRAERRLVIMTKSQKKRSGSLHFVHEMTRDGEMPGGLVLRSVDDVFTSAREAGVELTGQACLGGPPIRDRRAVVEQEKTKSRRAAAEALDSLDQPGVTAADLDAASARLRAAAARLAMAAHLGEWPDAPAWNRAEGLSKEAAALLERLSEGGADDGVVLRALKPPLKLSFTKVTAYERCPRCFYLEHVYRVREAAQPGLVLGSLAHFALQKFYENWRRAEADGKPPPTLKTLLDLGQREFFRVLAPGAEAPRDLLEQLKGQLTLAFDRLHNAADDIEELEMPLKFPYEHMGVQHEFEAKLDRLDRLPLPTGGHLIIDYKTGKATDSKRTPKTDDLQLGIYALALRHHQGIDYSDRETPAKGAAEYWLLSTGERGRIDLKDITYDRIRARIGNAIDGMLKGDFPRGKDCGGLCDILGPGI